MAERPVPPDQLVREGWDRASRCYRPEALTGADVFGHAAEDYRRWLAPLFEYLSPNDRVLDLGCGCGFPASALLAERFDVTGVDLSDVQIARARQLVPRATFLREDMTRVEFPPSSFRSVVCLYALIHVPLAAQRPLLARIRQWLSPRGWFLVITGHEAYEGTEGDWLGSGATMFWSHADAATYRAWIQEAGFEIVDRTFVPEGKGGHELFRARKT